jgi:hypothetical protein
MTEHEQEPENGQQDARGHDQDDVLEPQEGKGYGEDEGEREQSLGDA